ncbi:unnamed protein product [Chondrus crispus]|uniref:prephenate dehydratase n=1 Tax=Chondrus crispus TaxID=2769 RepID=R7QD97_CHOCR|nr:unnamed protein product [Chondrus crispus]CDF35420.1 unnamed protein product [Chondrus crispus]|eukprot:XP_005715239.1 unnamed protein product [Chondrus crispus]
MADLRVAYQGEPGAYSEQAALQYLTTAGRAASAVHFLPSPTFASAFEAVDSGLADRAVVPIENSLAGTIHGNLDLLLRYSRLTIIGELDFRVRHCLLALPGTLLRHVKVVRSHPMALAQCQGYLDKVALVSEVAHDTAGAARIIRKGQIAHSAAIASKRAAEIYNLNILAEGIEDDKKNFTRFLVLSKEKTPYVPHLPSKTSLVFSLINQPGILCRALQAFSVTAIDLSKIESRHIHTIAAALCEGEEEMDRENIEKRWGYVFYVDMERHTEEPAVQKALALLQEVTTFFRVLGSYPKHVPEVHDVHAVKAS